MSFLRFFPILLCLATISSATAQEIKCATVNAQQLLEQYTLAQKEIEPLQSKKEQQIADEITRNRELNKIEKGLKTIISKLRDKNLPSSDQASLRKNYNVLTLRHTELTQKPKESELTEKDKLDREIATLTRKHLDKIHATAQKYAKDNKYNWVIDTSGATNSQVSPLIYARETTDVTEEVLAILNKGDK